MPEGTKSYLAELATLENRLKHAQESVRGALACVDRLKKTAVKPRGRPRRHRDDWIIHKRVEGNPYPRKGGKRRQIYELFEDGGLVGDFRKRAIASGLAKDGWGYLRYNVRTGYIEVRQPAGL